MKYRVRNQDGELEYESFKQLEEAARTGFLDPDDEFLREGETDWKKVSTQPKLMPKNRGRSIFATPLARWILLAIMGALFAMWALYKGGTQHELQAKWQLYAAGLTAAFVAAGILFKVTTDAQKRR